VLFDEDLFEYQSIPQGGWMMPHVAGCAAWAGIAWLYEAGRGWV